MFVGGKRCEISFTDSIVDVGIATTVLCVNNETKINNLLNFFAGKKRSKSIYERTCYNKLSYTCNRMFK